MDSITTPLTNPAYVHGIYLIVLYGSLFALAIGVGLASRNSTALRYMNAMNRWVSLRKALKPLMVPHIANPALSRRPTVLGVLTVLGAAVSVLVLKDIDSDVFRAAFLGDSSAASAVALAELMKWFLLIGNGGCIVMGGLMLFSPTAWSRLERYADRWYSLRKTTLPLDKMHTELDGWVLAHPTVSGLTLVVLSSGLAVSMYARIF